MKNVAQIVAWIAPSLLLLIVYIGDSFVHPLITLSIFSGLMLVMAGVLGSAPAGAKPDEDPSGWFARGAEAWWLRGAGFAGLLLLALLLSDRPYQNMVMFPKHTGGYYGAVGIAIACLTTLLVRPLKPAVSLGVLLVAGLAVRTLWFSTWTINPARRDMLALVTSALDAFVSGDNPYGFHQMQRGSEVPLTYPPGLWLAHLPAYLAGVDIRWTAWLSDAVIVTALGGYSLRARSATTGPVLVALSVYLFLPDIHWNGIYAEPHADWAVLVALIVSALAGRPYLTSGLFGVALTTRPFNLILMPFFAIWLCRRFGPRRLWHGFLIAGGIAAAVYLPLVLADPDAFFAGTVRWLLDYGPVHRGWFYGKMSLSGPLYKAGLEHLLAPAQLVGVTVLTGLAVWRLKSSRHLAVFSMLMYALFVALNSIVWMSFWIGVCLLAIAYLAAAGVADTAETPLPSRSAWSRRRLVAEVVPAVGILSALAVLLRLLAAHFDTSGRDDAASYLAEQLDNDDLVVDNSGYRAGILKTPYLFERGDLPHGADLGENPFQAKLPRRRFLADPFRARVFAVDRFGAFNRYKNVYLGNDRDRVGPYVEKKRKQFKGYTVHVLEKRGKLEADRRLSDAPESLEIRSQIGGQAIRGERRSRGWGFPGNRAGARAGQQPCRINRSTAEMLFVVPRKNVDYIINTSAYAAKWVTIYGGFPDRSAAWHRSPVHVRLSSESDSIGEWRVPNRSGLRGATFAVPKGANDIQITLSSESPENPTLCFDALFWEAR